LEKLFEFDPLPHALLAKMDEIYNLSAIRNAEVRFRWQRLCLRADYEPIYAQVVQFVTEQGRMKFVRPLYKELHAAKNGGSELAKKTFAAHKDSYHPIAATMIEKDIL